MYTLLCKEKIQRSYDSIRILYFYEFIQIVTNFNFELFKSILTTFNIIDYLDDDGFIIGSIRDNRICEDEIELLSNDELLYILNKCLVNGYTISVI